MRQRVAIASGGNSAAAAGSIGLQFSLQCPPTREAVCDFRLPPRCFRGVQRQWFFEEVLTRDVFRKIVRVVVALALSDALVGLTRAASQRRRNRLHRLVLQSRVRLAQRKGG